MMSSLGLVRPSLRDLCRITPIPSVETLGYCQASLRDEDVQPLVVLEPPRFPDRGGTFKAEI